MCDSCGKGSVYTRHIQQTPFCAKCGARFVLQPRRREDAEETPTAAAPAAPPAPIAALYERHLAGGDSETASALLEQWPALAGKPAAAPDAPVETEMAVDAEGNGTLSRKQAETAVQKAHQKLGRARIEEEKQQAEWDKLETQMENIKVRVGEAALDHDKAFSAYLEAVARQAEVNNRTAFSSLPKPAAADVSTAALPALLYASFSPELGQAATDANAKIASLKLEIQTVIEAVQAQGREIEAQKAAAQQTSAPLPGVQAGPGEQGPGNDDGNATGPARTGNPVRKVRSAGGRPDADIEACKKLALDKAKKKAIKGTGALDSAAGVAGSDDGVRSSSYWKFGGGRRGPWTCAAAPLKRRHQRHALLR